MKYSSIKFELKDGHFQHNLDGDYAFFALWKVARSFRTAIREHLVTQFELLLETEIEWSEKYFNDNAARLYEEPLYYETQHITHRAIHAEKIGDKNFIIFIVKDNNPDYTYAKSVSGKIELSNLNVVRAKYLFRDWIQESSGIKYGVHSTNNIYEFFTQVPLLIGPVLFEKILHSEVVDTGGILKKDLEGAGGWNNYNSLFHILNCTSNYLIMRGFEGLPFSNDEKDIDVLTENYQKFASVLGIYQIRKLPYKGYVVVGKENVSVDIRYVGDKYYCVAWQQDMLQRKIMNNGLFIPRSDDYFFSLLHHCKVQKPNIKEKYYEILNSLASKLYFTWFNTKLLEDDKAVAQILNGFYLSQNYYYEDPLDIGVYKNEKVIKHLNSPGKVQANGTKVFKDIKYKIKRVLPKSIFELIKKAIRK